MAAYIEQHPGSPPTVKQHMAAIRMLFSWLTEKGILAMNPTREVKTQKVSRTEGKTPAPPAEEVQKFLESIDVSHLIGLRDRGLLAVMAYTFARIGAVDHGRDISLGGTLRDRANIDSRLSERAKKFSGDTRVIDHVIAHGSEDATILRHVDHLDLTMVNLGEKGSLYGLARQSSLGFWNRKTDRML